MSPFKSTSDFNDDWSGGQEPRRYEHGSAARGQKSAAPVLLPRRALAQIARRAPEVVVTLNARLRSPGALKKHFAYITRGGELALETSYGEALKARADVAALAEAWAFEARAGWGERRGSVAVTIVLSMPNGVDPKTVLGAARDFAADQFAGVHPYALTLHEDRDHPHVHLAAHSLGRGGARIAPDREELRAWRELFADHLRGRGVEAQATMRGDRGVVWRRDSGPLRRMEERHRGGQGALPNLLLQRQRDAMAEVMGTFRPSAFEARALARQDQLRAAYRNEIERLGASGGADDQLLAKDLRKLVEQMPANETRRAALARGLREAMMEEQSRGTLGPGMALYLRRTDRDGPERTRER